MFEKIYPILNVPEFSDTSVYASLEKLFDIFHAGKHELYLVGGCVRDLLLNKKPKDYDLCTDLTPEQVKELLSESDEKVYTFIDTGLKHGTVTIHDKVYNCFFEITTYRKESTYSDSRHPDSVEFVNSLEEDLKRRDLTINSFAYDLSTNKLVMLDSRFLQDIKFGIIRTVGDPKERFQEDALRILRAIRFASQLNFNIESSTYEAIVECAPLLAKISKERIRDELTKILLSDNPQMLEFISVSGMETFIFDGMTPITDMVNCDHQNPYHYTTVFHHTVDVIRGVDKKFELRWAAFFHDIGKPATKKLKPGTTDHYRFLGHPEASCEIATKLMDLLKFSNEQKELILKYVLYHDYPLSECSKKKFKKMIVEIGENNFPDFLKLRQADALAHQLKVSTSFAIDAISKCKDRFIDFLEHPEPLRLSDLAVNGDDLKAIGLKGKQIGEVLKMLLEKVLNNPNQNDKIKLLETAKGIKVNEYE